MGRAFLYLTWCSWRNRLALRVRRLREPRYAIGLLVGGMYFYYFLLRSRGRGGPGGALPLLLRYHDPIVATAALVGFAVAALAWMFAGTASTRPGGALSFTRADVQFLFPAPVTRRELVRYKVLRSQLGAVISTTFVTIFFRPATLASGWTFFAGMIVLMAGFNLHFTGVALRRQSLATHRRAGLARQWLPVAVTVLALAIVGSTIALNWQTLTSPGANPFMGLAALTSRGAVGVVLWPFRTLVSLPLSPSPAAFLRLLPLALLIVSANYFWVEQSDVAFEEAAAAHAEQLAARPAGGQAAAAPRVRDAATPFALGATGAPEWAILWKNLILVSRYASLKSLSRLLPLVVVAGFVLARGRSTGGLAEALGACCVFGVAFALLFGPQMARNDLRQDLLHLATLRTWPVRGASIVRGEVLAPAVLLSGIVWLLILGAAALSPAAPAFGAFAVRRLSLAIGAMIVAPGILLLQVIVQNAIAIAFPAWIQIGASRARGLDVTGQRLVMLAGMLIVLVVALLPAAVAAGILALAIYRTWAIVPIIAPALVVLVVLLVEALVATEWLGGVFERTDVGVLTSET